MRLNYQPNPPKVSSEEDQAIVKRVEARRGARGLQPLDLTLLHSPPLADGWNSFLGAVRTRCSLPTSIRETAICRVAVLNKAWYEWMHHAPLLRDAEDAKVTSEGLDYVKDAPLKGDHTKPVGGLEDRQLAVLAYTDYMTVGCEVPDEVFTKVKQVFSEREVVEITGTVAAYNCVSRFLVALDVGEKNGKGVPDISGH